MKKATIEEEEELVVVPQALIGVVLCMAHSSPIVGHFGEARTLILNTL